MGDGETIGLRNSVAKGYVVPFRTKKNGKMLMLKYRKVISPPSRGKAEAELKM